MREPHNLEPLPAGARLLPPTAPPAPPGAPSTPPPGVPSPPGGELLIGLNACRNALLLLRMAVEAGGVVAEPGPVRDTLTDLLTEAREDLRRHFQDLQQRLLTDPKGFPRRELGVVRDVLLDLVRSGVARETLNRELQVDVFSEGGTASEAYGFMDEAHLDLKPADELTGVLFVAVLLEHLRNRVADRESYTDLAAFDARLYRQLLFVLYGVSVGTGCYLVTAVRPRRGPASH